MVMTSAVMPQVAETFTSDKAIAALEPALWWCSAAVPATHLLHRHSLGSAAWRSAPDAHAQADVVGTR